LPMPLQNHHPDIFISDNKVRLTLSTHKVARLVDKLKMGTRETKMTNYLTNSSFYL
jgi:pterin-4a-carbinolamine dehydratase